MVMRGGKGWISRGRGKRSRGRDCMFITFLWEIYIVKRRGVAIKRRNLMWK